MYDWLEVFINACNKVPTVSPSQLRMYEDCAQKHYYAYGDQLRKTGQNTFYMDRGTYFHRLCHYYYNLLRTGFRPGSPTVLAAMAEKMIEDVKEMAASGNDSLIPIIATTQPYFKEYIESYSPRFEMGLQILEVEHEFVILIKTPKGRYVFLHGFIDLIYRDALRKLRVRDHKTGERSDTYNEYKVQMDDQLFFYNYAMNLQYQEEAQAVEISFINLAKKPEKRFAMFVAYHEQKELDFYGANLMKILDKMFDGDVHRSYSGKCSSCPYFKICQLEGKGLPTASTIATHFERTNRGHKPGLSEPGPEIQEIISGSTTNHHEGKSSLLDFRVR